MIDLKSSKCSDTLPASNNLFMIHWISPAISQQGQQMVKKVFEGDGLKAPKTTVPKESLFPCSRVRESIYLRAFDWCTSSTAKITVPKYLKSK